MESRIQFNPSFYKKCGPKWKQVIDDVLTDLALETERKVKETGYCPVITGNLKNGYSVDVREELCKKLTKDVEYWQPVVYGSSRGIEGNDFPMRAIESVINDGSVKKALDKNMRKYGIK